MGFCFTNASTRYLLVGLFCAVHIFAKAAIQDNSCALLISPMQGETNVSVTTAISFETVPGAVNYFVDLGTTSGGFDILNNFNVGISGSFVPPQGLPESTVIYITIRAFFISDSTTCDTQSFTTEDVMIPPSCTQVTSPSDGEVEVAVTANLSWGYAPRATGYLVNLGTTPGGTNVLNGIDAGNVLLYDIPFDLDPLTTYYVTIIPYNENGQVNTCNETSFTTEFLDMFPPICTQLITPEDGAIEVALTPILSWTPVSNADGYIITVGSTPGGTDVLDNTNIGNQTSTAVIDFIEGTTYYVTITPYNDAGMAMGCNETSFTTTFGCGPYIDDLTGELIDLNPIIEGIEPSYQICKGDNPLQLSYNAPAFSVVWYTMAEFGEVVYSTENTISVDEAGLYRLEVTTEEVVEAGTILCTSSQPFEVTVSEAPVIESVSFVNQGNTASVTLEVSGEGDYEYASSPAGPYQSSPTLNNVPFSNISVYVRDRNGCGQDEKIIRPDLGFPKYFTPNNDGINDTWQVRGVVVDGETITQIEIFDRFGKRIITISPYSSGWDGTYAGKTMLDQGYWFKARTTSSKIFTGYFALRK